jgi:L-threonylcarbamoyladenylate synthase
MPPSKATKVLRIDPQAPLPKAIQEAARIIHEGRLVAFPTDTLYGLGANAFNPQAIEAVYFAKARPRDKPLIVLAKDLSMVEDLVEGMDEVTRELMDRFWPGPLTLILHASAQLPACLTANTRRLGVRIPNSPISQTLLKATDLPLTAPSANRSGSRDPLDAKMVWEELSGRIDLLLDGGPVAGIPSTILDLTCQPPKVIRQGAIPRKALAGVIELQEGP